MSTTTLTRNQNTVATPLARAPRPVPPAAAVTPPSRRFRRRRNHSVMSATTHPRVMDMHIRTVALWPRAYR